MSHYSLEMEDKSSFLSKVLMEVMGNSLLVDSTTDPHTFKLIFCFSPPMGSGSHLDKKRLASNETSAPAPSTPQTPEEEEEHRLGLKSPMAKNIFRILFRTPLRRVNELFLPHRMAYIIDLENPNGQQDDENDKGSHPMDDIPTTLIRSKADCPNAEVRLRGARLAKNRRLLISRPRRPRVITIS